ncbi:protein of unknown function [Nitrospira japonica]|uniref:Uncharacterized protein n=1 Tax=Nitrospira japonica TaxID=1325564 RepID=A0A1W1IAT8_9BACT|nr:protein of unknown function [Nitrospira japonica]
MRPRLTTTAPAMGFGLVVPRPFSARRSARDMYRSSSAGLTRMADEDTRVNQATLPFNHATDHRVFLRAVLRAVWERREDRAALFGFARDAAEGLAAFLASASANAA